MNSDKRDIINDILAVFYSDDGFIIFNHTNPDGDAIGSQLGLFLSLSRSGKKAYMYSAEAIGADYDFLPHVREINMHLPSDDEFKIAIILDCANPERIGKGNRIDLGRYHKIINIDHHISNSKYGTLNWIVPESSSTGELVYQLIKKGKYAVDDEIASCLYASIFSDTGGFRHSNTTAKALKIASKLVTAGALPHLIARHLYGGFPERRFRLLGKALGTLKTAENGKVAYMWIRTMFYSETGSTFADADEFVEFPRSLKRVEIACVFKETKDDASARVNLRSNSPEYNVNRVALKFGGGGHAEAAACNIEGSRNEMEQKILDAVREELAAGEKIRQKEGNN